MTPEEQEALRENLYADVTPPPVPDAIVTGKATLKEFCHWAKEADLRKGISAGDASAILTWIGPYLTKAIAVYKHHE